MIVTPCDGRLRLIRQTDHAALAGAFARHWGNGTFARLEPFDPMVLAAAEHDNGWHEWDEHPKLNPATRRPAQFTELPVAEHLAFYQRGVERVVARDRYAGLLVNMHCVGLYNSRYGTDPSLQGRRHAPAEQETIRQFRERLEAQQQALRRELCEAGMPPRWLDEPTIWTNYKVLQMVDRLSLYVCMGPGPARKLGPAPVDYAGRDVAFALDASDGHTVTIDPYPFDGPLRVTVPARFIPHRPYADGDDLRATLAGAEALTLPFELCAVG